MKFNTIVKIFTALAAVVGAIYIIATYGDKIVEWAKGIMNCCCSKPAAKIPTPEAPAEDFVPENPEPVQEAPADVQEAAEEAPAAEEAAEEPAAEPVLSNDAIPVADEEDFEG